MQKLVLFDIDGTLLWTDGAGRRAIHAALRVELGLDGPFVGVRFDGKTDPQIVRELLIAARHDTDVPDARVEAICRRYVGLLEQELAAGTRALRIFPGVLELLDVLAERGDALIGLLTGNVVDGAMLKLRAAGIAPERFRVGAYGSDAADRRALPPIAVARAAPLMGRRPLREEVVIIGDTPSDMSCGQDLGVRAIGVATGSYTPDELTTAGGHAVFETFADPAPVLEAIYR